MINKFPLKFNITYHYIFIVQNDSLSFFVVHFFRRYFPEKNRKPGNEFYDHVEFYLHLFCSLHYGKFQLNIVRCPYIVGFSPDVAVAL